MEDHIPPAIALDVSPMRTMVTSRRDETEVVIPDVIPDVTFDLTGPQFQGASAPLEQSLPDRELTDDIPDDTPTTYEIVEAGTKRGAPKLVGSSKQDYVSVLTSLRQHLDQPLVEWFMIDFEAAEWQAIREVFPRAVVTGCVFQFTQRIYRKIQAEGLATAYIQKGCVFREQVRTNNDLEGWHRRLNTRAGHPNLGLYKLVTLLRDEADTVDIQIRLVSEYLLCKIRRKKYKQLHGRLEDAWDRYEEDELTTTALLRTISHITGLGPTSAAMQPRHRRLRRVYPD